MTIPPLACLFAWTMLGPREDVDDAIARAEAHFLAEEYDRASEAFAEAHALDPDPRFLYARAQAERLNQNCVVAIDLYEQFLETDPPEPASAEAIANRDRCEASLDSQRRPPSAPAPPPPPPADAPPPTPTMPRDPLGLGLLGSGGVALAVGGGLWGVAVANDREAPEAGTERRFLDEKRKARSLQRAGIAVTSIGAALLIAGAIRLIVVGKRHQRNATATVTFDRTGAGVGISGRF